MTGSSVTGPTILWNQLKGKEVKTHDGKDIGEIKEISQHYLRLEKGTISKEKFLFGQEPPAEQFTRDFEAFKTTKGMDVYNSEGVRVKTGSAHEEESTTISHSSSEEYKNIRDLEK